MPAISLLNDSSKLMITQKKKLLKKVNFLVTFLILMLLYDLYSILIIEKCSSEDRSNKIYIGSKDEKMQFFDKKRLRIYELPIFCDLTVLLFFTIYYFSVFF